MTHIQSFGKMKYGFVCLAQMPLTETKIVSAFGEFFFDLFLSI
jgi:hypothetical protein